jgi:hypothetical protein
MVRTQIQLTDDQARRLRRRARQDGVSMSAVIRRFLDHGLVEATGDRSDLYRNASGLVGGFPDRERAKDLASEHDRHLDEAFR